MMLIGEQELHLKEKQRRAEEKRNIQLQEKIRKAQEEDAKVQYNFLPIDTSRIGLLARKTAYLTMPYIVLLDFTLLSCVH